MGSSPSTSSRELIVTAIRKQTEPIGYIQCMWEGGATAFDRVDEWSDIDLQLAVDDEKVNEAVGVVERIIEETIGIEKKLVLPQPTTHGHWQAFYLLKGTSPFLLIDIVVMKRSATNRFSQPEIHGRSKIAYDKIGFLKTKPLDEEEFSAKLQNRRDILARTFELFQPFVLKELNRKNYVEAIAYYNSVTLRPLVEMLRMKYCPARHDFYTRYAYYDLPRDIAGRLERFFFVADPDDLKKKHQAAIEWFQELVSTANP